MKTMTTSKTQLWLGRVMSGLVILFMLFDAIGKLTKQPEALKITVGELGYAEHHMVTLGLLALAATALYAIPRTAIFGAILLTGYWGGAIASQLRVDHPLFSNTLFPLYLALVAWAGLFLQEAHLKELLFRKAVVEKTRAADTVWPKARQKQHDEAQV
ncbi:MAG TPA: DoxX family protein [Flavisolibacter sp.]|nr:DoxX family protein [Flavisolibacter sp.]